MRFPLSVLFALLLTGCFPEMDFDVDLNLRVVRAYDGEPKSRDEVARVSSVAISSRGRSLFGLVRAMDGRPWPDDLLPHEWEVLPGPHTLEVRCVREKQGESVLVPYVEEGVQSLAFEAEAGQAYLVFIRETDSGPLELEVETITNGS